MSRTLIAVASALVLIGASEVATAQTSSYVLYGVIDASGSWSRPVGGDHRWELNSGDMTTSYLGFRGTEDLGGGLRAVFKLESYVRVDTGNSGRNTSDAFFGRNANVGFSGAFGTTVLGRSESPLYLSTTRFNPFGESFGFSPSVRQYYGATSGVVLGDRSWNNSMNYTNNASQAPLRVNLAANFGEKATDSGTAGANLGGSVSYIAGPFAATLAAERIRNSAQPLPAGFYKQLAYQAGATYDFKLVRLYGQIGYVRTDATLDEKTTLWQLGAAVPIGTSLVLVAYGQSHTKSDLAGTTDRIGSIGYDYFLSKRTDVYVAASYEKTSFVSPNGASFAGGVRHRF